MRAYQFLLLFFAAFSLQSFAGSGNQSATGASPLDPNSGYYGTVGQGKGGAQNSKTPAPAPARQAAPANAPAPEYEEPQTTSGSTKTQRICAEANAQREICFANSQAAVASCDEGNDSSLQTTLRNVQDVTGQADQILSATGLNGGCGVVIKAANSLSSAYLAYNQTCGQKVSSCISSCEAVESLVQACDAASFTSSIAQPEPLMACRDLEGKQSQRNQFQNSVPALANQAAACKAAFNAKGDGGICASNPGSLMCQQSLKEAANAGNCSDPSMASTVTCACKGGVNTSACQAAMNGSQKLSNASSLAMSSNSRLQGATGKAVNAAPNFDDANGEMGPGTYKSQASEEIGGRMGNSASLGGGGGSGSGIGGSGGYSESSAGGINTNINGGAGRGGGAGGGAWNGGGAGRAGGGAGRYAGAGGAINGMPNLNNFRPQMGNHGPVRRDLAGVVGPDGLLGPHADPWQTIKNRYNYEWRQGTLKP